MFWQEEPGGGRGSAQLNQHRVQEYVERCEGRNRGRASALLKGADRRPLQEGVNVLHDLAVHLAQAGFIDVPKVREQHDVVQGGEFVARREGLAVINV